MADALPASSSNSPREGGQDDQNASDREDDSVEYFLYFGPRIPGCTSKWKAYTTRTINGKTIVVDLLRSLNVNKRFVPLERFFDLPAVQFMLPNDIAPDDNMAKEHEYMDVLRTHLTFDVPEWGLSEETDGCLSGGHSFAGYFSGVTQYKKREVIDSILSNIDSTTTKLQEKSTTWQSELVRLLPKVQDFLETVIKFLALQKDAGDGAYEDLFTAFCAMVGLHFSKGSDLKERTMQVLGYEVTSRTDLRAFSSFMGQCKGARGLGKFPELKVIAAVEVKASVPSTSKEGSARRNPTRSHAHATSADDMASKAFAHIEENLGQIFGDLLAERPHGRYTDSIFGICVQGSRVQLLVLETNPALLAFIHSDGSDDCFERRGNPGTLYITEPKDFMKKSERNDILEAFRKLAKACSSV